MAFSPLASPSATRAVLSSHGFEMRKSLGQHFLVDDNVVGRILDLADISPADVVLEVGPGIGTLTVALCDRAKRVVAVERDARLLPVLADTAGGCQALDVVRADAAAVSPEALSTADGPPIAFVANLPYAVAATVVLRFFEILPGLKAATVMVQAEVADRMAAHPGTKDYGAYTVKLSLLARPAGRFFVSRNVFLPPPRVDSAVIRLERVERQEPPALLSDAARTAAAAFSQRRKTLRNSLTSALGAPAPTVESALAAVGIDGRMRAETLDTDDFVRLAVSLREAGILPG